MAPKKATKKAPKVTKKAPKAVSKKPLATAAPRKSARNAAKSAPPVVPPPTKPVPSLPSPTGSIGNFSNIPTASPAVVAAARRGPSNKLNTEPWGWKYTNNTCYRNSVAIMLLCSDRLMSFIEQSYLPTITTQQAITALITAPGEAPGSDAVDEEYTDTLMELHKLWVDYWSVTTQREVDEAMERFWAHALSVTAPYPWVAGPQHDGPEFLSWLLMVAEADMSSRACLVPSLSHLHDIVQHSTTTRRRCNGCRAQHNVRERITNLDNDYLWRLSMDVKEADPNGGADIKKTSLTLADCLQKTSSRQIMEGYYCSNCQAQFDQDQASKTTSTTQRALQDRSTDVDYIWRNICSLPEVLFMQLLRFSPDNTGNHVKDPTFVDVPEEVDLAPYVERTSTADQTDAKYRLVSLIAHSGSMTGGHYINYSKVGTQWWMIDGTKRTSINFAHINAKVRKGRAKVASQSMQPYLMIWERISGTNPAAGSKLKGKTGGDAGSEKNGGKKGNEGKNGGKKSGKGDKTNGQKSGSNNKQGGKEESGSGGDGGKGDKGNKERGSKSGGSRGKKRGSDDNDDNNNDSNNNNAKRPKTGNDQNQGKPAQPVKLIFSLQIDGWNYYFHTPMSSALSTDPKTAKITAAIIDTDGRTHDLSKQFSSISSTAAAAGDGDEKGDEAWARRTIRMMARAATEKQVPDQVMTDEELEKLFRVQDDEDQKRRKEEQEKKDKE